ncbi:MAG TPA: stage V sporulation protein AD, partial [Clostridiales bacterium]|nr:stage V sporulation protein AD [Clostridiales bacterium]
NNMGAAMAPAAADTILAHLSDLGLDANYYDAIVTGDLGLTGSGILRELMDLHGCSLYRTEEDRFIHQDCGAMIFDPVKQKTNSGGSGCGCGTAVFANYFYKQLQYGILKRILFVGTGALMSPISVKQAESISGIAHAVAIEAQ